MTRSAYRCTALRCAAGYRCTALRCAAGYRCLPLCGLIIAACAAAPKPAAPVAAAPTPAPALAPAPPPRRSPPPQALAFPEDAFRKDQPVPGAPAAFKPQKPERFVLPSGITVYLVERHQIPAVTLSLVFPGGAASDPPGREGRAALCMDLLTESTRRLDKVAFAEAQADLAADVSSFSGDEQMGIGVSALTRHLDRALDLFAEALLTPGLREVDLDRQIKRSLAGLKQQKGSPGGVSDRLDSFLLYGPRHPEGRIVTEASLATINVGDCAAFLAAHLKPQGAELYVVGDIAPAQLREKVNARLRGFSGKAPAAPPTPAPAPQRGRLFFVDIPQAPQSQVKVMDLGPPRQAPDYFAVSLMSSVLGGGFTSRINMNIREKNGYAYGAFGRFSYARRGPSLLTAGGAIRSDVTGKAIAEILGEIKHLQADGVTDDELTRERDGAVLAFPSRFQTAQEVLGSYRSLIYFGLPLSYYDTYITNVRAQTRATVNAAAKRYLRPAETRVFVVGDRQTVLPQLEAVARDALGGAPIIELDADGRPVAATKSVP